MTRKGTDNGKGSAMTDSREILTDEEWNKMKKYGTFRVSDKEGVDYKFRNGDTATILPSGTPPGAYIEQREYWVADIVEVRGISHDDDDTNDVWAEVRWWYSAQDVKGVIKSFDPTKCSPYERIRSDHFDRVYVEAFNEVIKMQTLRDDDPEQPYIDPEDFYYRYEINRRGKRLNPKPGSSTCTCSVPYAYHDESTVMHFCPRPTCRKWYHESCLVQAASVFQVVPARLSNGKAKRGRPPLQKSGQTLSLLLTSPNTTSTLSLPSSHPERLAKRRRMSLRSCVSTPPQKYNKGKTKVRLEDAIWNSNVDDEFAQLEGALKTLPQKLVQVASQPIVRGSLYATGGVSGNVRAVVRARKLVYEVLGLSGDEDDMDVDCEDLKVLDVSKRGRGRIGSEVPDDWEESILGPESPITLEDCLVKIKGKRKTQVLACPECASAI